jgi:hypothetical protein
MTNDAHDELSEVERLRLENAELRETVALQERMIKRLALNDRGPAPQNFTEAEAAFRTGLIGPACEYDEITGGIKKVTYPGVEWKQPKPPTQRQTDTEIKYFMIRVCFGFFEEKNPGQRKRNIDSVVQNMKRLGVRDVRERTVENALAAAAAPRIDVTPKESGE